METKCDTFTNSFDIQQTSDCRVSSRLWRSFNYGTFAYTVRKAFMLEPEATEK